MFSLNDIMRVLEDGKWISIIVFCINKTTKVLTLVEIH